LLINKRLILKWLLIVREARYIRFKLNAFMMTSPDGAANTDKLDWKRWTYVLLGIILFIVVYLSPSWPDAIDPQGQIFSLTREGKAALGLFLLAAVWWVFEVVPIGVTAIAIGVVQALFSIRDAQTAFTDFMNPSIWFIFASLVIGRTFTKSGLTQRMAYNMLVIVGERTSMIYLGSFILIGILTLIMAHTAVAATIYPLLMAIYSMYSDEEKPTRFGKGLFVGMAFVAGAGSIVTLLGAARGAVAIGFFKDIVGREISFFDYSYYLAPVGWVMLFLLWGFFLIFFKPEKRTIPGLREQAKSLRANLGRMTRVEWFTLIVVMIAIAVMSLRSFIPAFKPLDKAAIILTTTVLFFLFKILKVQDLEEVPWNIVLLFGGAMSIGFCLWETGAARWLAVHWLGLFQEAHWFVFVMGIAFFVLVMTNLIMNVAAIAITIPIALMIAPYLGVAPDVVMFAGDGGDAVSLPGGRGTQRHRLREPTVYFRRVLEIRHSSQYIIDDRFGGLRQFHLALDGDAGARPLTLQQSE
jgi:sodium-dependent dicarboxylate transporter 2/3/5